MDPSSEHDPATTPIAGHPLWGVIIVLLAAITLGVGLPLTLRCTLDGQINYNEGWNAFRQRSASLWQPLYKIPDLEVTNYPPLSFHLIGLLGRMCGDVVLAGRLVSLLAIALIALVLNRIGRRLSGSEAVAACCSLSWFVGIEFWTPERIGTDDPQLLAMAIQALGLLAFLHRPVGLRSMVAAATLISLGLFTKHNLLALPVGMVLSLIRRRAWRDLVVWLLAATASCVVLLLGTIVLDGRLFLSNMLAPRAFLPEQTLAMSLSYVLFTSPILVVIAAWAWLRRGSTVESPLVLCWISSLLEIVVFAGGDGVAGNIFQDAIMMSALLQPLALQQLLARPPASARRWFRGGLIWASLLMLPMFLAGRIPAAWRTLQAMSQQQAGFRQGVSLIRDRQGPVMCETLLLCFRAGKPSTFDAYYVQDGIMLGRIRADRIDELVERHVLAAVAVGSSEDPELPDPASTPWRFSHSFMRALWTNYRPVLSIGGFTIFVPREVQEGLTISSGRASATIRDVTGATTQLDRWAAAGCNGVSLLQQRHCRARTTTHLQD